MNLNHHAHYALASYIYDACTTTLVTRNQPGIFQPKKSNPHDVKGIVQIDTKILIHAS
jgi:hypothetical protein